MAALQDTDCVNGTLEGISEQIWREKYRHGEEASITDSWDRVARALAAVEDDAESWTGVFRDTLSGFGFLPAGRILAGAGTGRAVTLFNCFVMGTIPDDMSGIFTALREAALTLQQGGGIGYDFSTLRPKGAPVRGVGADASGPLSFMDVWNAMCGTIMSAGARRGAMMATLRCDHPDIDDFIAAKRDPARLRMFNLSVLVTDPFMQAVAEDDDWDLVFGGAVWRTVRARDLWDRILRATYDVAEPGVIFIDRINRQNPIAYCETIAATNPCGEQPLPPYGACLLGSVNLARFVEEPFTADGSIDLEGLGETVAVAVRMLDNAIDASRFPLPEQATEARAKRRIGLGVTGLADALVMCGIRYGSDGALEATRHWLREVRDAAARASVALAREKGPFPLFDAERYLDAPGVRDLPDDIRDGIREHGIRNGLLTSIAPTGTISLLAGNLSSGIEPIFALEYERTVLDRDGSRRTQPVVDHAVRLFRRLNGPDAPLPDAFVTAQELTPDEHIAMQGAAQEFVDSAISKTVNVPEAISFDEFRAVYQAAWDAGCKGCTTYRPNPVTGAVLAVANTARDTEAGALIERPEVVGGRTYKMRWPGSDHAIYITINDIDRDGRRVPFEVFINSKNMGHYAWTVALTRMISAVFRRGGDVSFVAEELQQVFDPRGGAWIERKYVPSLLAAIGGVIEKHLRTIGFLDAGEAAPADTAVGDSGTVTIGSGSECGRCGAFAVVRTEGCDLCTACGYSTCG